MKCLPLLALTLLTAGTLHAQPAAAPTAASLIAEGDQLDAQLKTEAALKVYLQAEKLEPASATTLIKIAKQYGESMTAIPKEADKLKAAENALAYAQRALKLAPRLSDANLAVAICYGRLLKLVSVKTKVEDSRLIREYAQKALQLDPASDYAWHKIGRAHV